MHTYIVWREDESIDDGDKIEAWDEESAAEKIAEKRDVDWEYPDETSVFVLREGRPAKKRKYFEIVREEITRFHVSEKEDTE
jgi:hypothetical protein